MKKSFAVFCALVLMPGLNAHAWVGGPWSNNNSLESGDDGIYEAVATMTNGSGLYRWAVRNNSVQASATASTANAVTPQASNVMFGGMLRSQSANVWYYRGIVYYGPAFGIVNSGMGIVSVVANATTDGLFSGNTINNVNIAGPTPGNIGVPTAVGTTGANNASTGNIGYANSSFRAKIDSKAPVKRFSGTGVISFNGVPDSSALVIEFTDIVAGGTTTVTHTTSSTGGESGDFSQVGAKRNFKVMGTQVSIQVLP